MDRIEEFKFLEGLKRSGFTSKESVISLLTKVFNLTKSEATELLYEFNSNYESISIALNSNESRDWTIAWDNVEYNKFILKSPPFDNFDKERIMSEFNVSNETATKIMLEFAQNYQKNYAVMVLERALSDHSQQENER